MTLRACIRCSHQGVGTFCPVCGTRQDRPETVDPAVGRVVADRYEILAPMKEGGMGRIYVALQRSLKRKVALKLIRPTMTSVDRIADRFLVEAQAASQLNHPNVVSIYDFGQSGQGSEAELFLVMELLAGTDLRELLDSGAQLPPERIVDILRQTLAGLAEAHDHGISHRDIKPDNIFLESTRRGKDRVKLIDFGVARVEREESLTLAGQFVGTPCYSAPEQVHGDHGPLSDIYSVGVVLFEMLTGDLPFDDPSPVQILIKHQTAPRPDPVARGKGRDVPRALAEVCFRAMSIKADRRYPDAEAMADALLAALESGVPARSKGSIFPKRSVRSSIPPEARRDDVGRPTSESVSDFGVLESILPRAPTFPNADAFPLLGRDADLAWVDAFFAGNDRCAVIHGRPGVGRSRFLRELVRTVEARGGRPLMLGARAAPRNQIGYLGLRDLITLLSGRSTATLVRGGDAPEPAASGLRAIFSDDGPAPSSARIRASAAVRWALDNALDDAPNRGVVLFVDDADLLDGPSMLALSDALREAPLLGLKVVMTSLGPSSGTSINGVATRELRGLAPADVASLITVAAELAGAKKQLKITRLDSVEPLYIEHAWAYIDDQEEPPATLAELIAARVEGLFPAERRALQALSIIGACSMHELSVMLDEDGVTDTVKTLVDGRFAEVALGTVRMAHRLIAEQVIALAPAGTSAALHARAYDALPAERGVLELRAFHAVRGRADFETFFLVEEAARLRSSRDDHDGAVVMLCAGLDGAVTRSRRGDFAAQSAERVFTRKLGVALLDAGYPEQVKQLLEAALANPSLVGTERGLVLEQLALACIATGRHKHAEKLRADALVLARAAGDEAFVHRLAAPPSPPSRPKRAYLYWTPYGARAPATKSIASMQRVSVERVARRDPRREEE